MKSIVTHDDESDLVHQMFVDRTKIFKDRLNWEVKVNDKGEERDQYDNDNAAYIILSDDSGRHLASMRMMRLNDACMTTEAFPGLFSRDMINDIETSVEVTRFCIIGDQPLLGLKLFIAAADWMDTTDYTSFVGVFYKPMMRIYRRIGWSPELINEYDGLCLGRWKRNSYSQGFILSRDE